MGRRRRRPLNGKSRDEVLDLLLPVSEQTGAAVSAGEREKIARLNLSRYYPPAMAPIIRYGSLPRTTASGNAASGGSWDRSSSQAKNRMNGPPPAAVLIADRAAQHRVPGLERVEHRTLRDLAGEIELDLALDAGESAQVRGKHDPDHACIPIMKVSGPRPTARRAGRGRSVPTCRRHWARRRPDRRSCRSTRRMIRASPRP